MKKIKIQGGLGNQMFQYAYGRKLELSGKKIIFDISFFYGNKSKEDTARIFHLNNFNIKTKSEFIKKNKEFFYQILLDKILNKIKKKDPFFQSEKNFITIKTQILEEFTLKNPLSPQAQEIFDKIKKDTNPISIHIRRGDYANDPKTNQYHGTCDTEYYEEAMKIINERTSPQPPTFYVFSDEINWAKENLKKTNLIFISNSNIPDYEEMYLMSQCKHNIIANSTFSWWGAWLNKNPTKLVVAPKKWTRHQSSDQFDILPKEWIQIET